MEDSGGSAMIRLTDKNWVTWKPRMEGILYCKDLHEPIEGDEAKPEEMTEKQWYILNRKAIGTIIKWVDDSVFCHVAQETNAHKLWTKLEVMFEKKAVTKKYFMIKDLVNMKYKEDMNMTVHLNNFHNIINQLATMGMVLEDELQALLLLSSLPDGWETFVVTLSDSAANGVLYVDFVKDSMQREETRKKISGVCTEQMESDNQKMEDDKNALVVVHFRALERPKEDEFCIELAKNHTYDDVVERVAQHLGLDDPSKIRLAPHNCYSQQPKPNPIKYRSVDRLLDMLFHYNQISDILYYEVLDIPLPELQCLKTLKVAFHHATKDEAVVLNIRLPRQSTVGDMLNEIKTKVELSHPNAELRLLEVFCHKIYKIFPPNEKIENINDQYWTLRAEEIPEEEKNLGPNSRLINVYHFTKENAQNQVQVQSFGEPLFLVNHDGETLADVKIRIQKKLQVPDEEFSKWKFAFLSLGRPEYLEDSDIVSSHFQRRDVYGAWVQYIVVEHSDATPKRSCTANQMRMKRKQEEKEAKRIYREAPLCRIIEVARDEDLKEQIGKDIYFDLVDHDKVRSFIIQKQTPFNHFKEEVAREFGIPVEFQRFWMWAKRKNHTYRPHHPLTPHEEAQTVGALREFSNQAHNVELKLFLEVYHGQDLHPVPPPVKNEDDILLFFKLYDPEKEELRYVGRFFVKSSSKTMEILVKLNELAGFAPDEEIELFEEIKFEPSVMCERLDKGASFRFSQIENGDIICFQKKPLPEGEEKFRYPDVPSFLEYVKNRQKRCKFEKYTINGIACLIILTRRQHRKCEELEICDV